MAHGKIGEEGGLFRSSIGGSAVPEGVMMRGRYSWAVAVRCPNGGIHVEEHDLRPSQVERRGWYRVPIVRGCISFAESLELSAKALAVSNEYAYGPTGQSQTTVLQSSSSEASRPAPLEHAQTSEKEGELQADASREREGSSFWSLAGGVILGLVLGIALFVALPTFAAGLMLGDYAQGKALPWNLLEAAVRILVFIGYVWACGFQPDVRRTLGYHGAEHESIHCLEHGDDLEPSRCARYSRLHIRCGTSLAVVAILVAILVNALIPAGDIADAWGATGWVRLAVVVLLRLAAIPLVIGISYEISVRWAGPRADHPLVRLVLMPGLLMQRLTTREPDEGMLECAVLALERVHARELREAWAKEHPAASTQDTERQPIRTLGFRERGHINYHR